jgi:protein-disulfide isomerase
MSPTAWTGLVAVLALSVTTPGATRNSRGDRAADDPSAADSTTVIGIVDGKKITEADLIAGDRVAFATQDADYEARVHGLQAKHAQDHYDLVKEHLDYLLDQRALELEAQSQHTSTAVVLTSIRVPAVSENDARAYYEENKARTTQSFDQVKAQILQYLTMNRNTTATRAFYDDLRAKYKLVYQLPPYRVAVAATGPTKGPTNAPVTIVEFADFQCPFCKEAESTVQSIVANHSDSVRLVFRNLPLASVHPDATLAAVAGVCADRQGKFWPMHDAMFQDQAALGESGLKATAKRLGLDESGFSACLADPSSKAAVDSDSKAASGLNLDGTPYFFINGRPLYGNLPQDQIESVINEELQRTSNKRG